MKIHNCQLGVGEFGIKKHIIKLLLPFVPDIEDIVGDRYAMLRTQDPAYEKKYDPVNPQKYGGINFSMDRMEFACKENNNFRIVETIRFGVRTDKEGYLDIEKLAKKFNDNMERIEAAIASNKAYLEERERRFEAWHKNIDIVYAMRDEGLLDENDAVEETNCTFEFTMVFRSEEELRDAAEYYLEVKKNREIKEEA